MDCEAPTGLHVLMIAPILYLILFLFLSLSLSLNVAEEQIIRWWMDSDLSMDLDRMED